MFYSNFKQMLIIGSEITSTWRFNNEKNFEIININDFDRSNF